LTAQFLGHLWKRLAGTRLRRRALGNGDKGLRQKLLIGAGVAIVCTAILAASILARSYDDYRRTRQNLVELESFRFILDTANLLSAERGPSNSVLGEQAAANGALRDRLTTFRARSDAALDRLMALPRAASRHAEPAIPANLLTPVREQLVRARSEVDRVAALPASRRRLEDVQSVIENMFQVVDIFQTAVRWKMNRLVVSNPDLAAELLTGEMFSELREYGGRIASQIMAPIAVRQPQPVHNLVAANQTRGRLLELWHLTGAQQAISTRHAAFADALADAERQFFGDGLAMVDARIAEGRESGRYAMTAEKFTDEFVPTLEPLERSRQIFLDITVADLAGARDRALSMLTITIAVTTIFLATLTGLILAAQRFIFGPLLQARNEVIGLANDQPVAPVRPQHHAPEMRRLFDAINVLRDNLAERASLTQQLRQLAETDGLTGLMNRRMLEIVGENRAGGQSSEGVCLILMDIDHFKDINDTFGHLEGDRVLRECALLVSAMLRADDIFARFGGEEFAILVPDDDLAAAVALAQRARHMLQTSPIRLSDGTGLCITASFGVAAGTLGQVAWQNLIEAADTALYRAKSEGRNRVRFADAVGLVPAADAAGLEPKTDAMRSAALF
jgi:diguanylate cyclase (GGDEF)-like protein